MIIPILAQFFLLFDDFLMIILMHVVEIERPVRRKPLPSSATRAAMYPSRA